MSTFKRNLRHQIIARQGGVTLVDPLPSTTSEPPKPPPPSTSPPPPKPSTTTPTTRPRPEPSTTRERDPTTTSEKPEPTEPSTTRSTTESSSTNTESNSASVSRSVTSVPSPTRIATLPNTNTALRTGLSPTVTDDLSVPSISSEAANDGAKPSGAINTGAVIGGIAGGIAAIALLGILISFFLRRMRNRRREEEFNASQFRRSAMMMDGAEDTRPNSLFGGRWGGFAPSIRTSVVGGGMAGAGAFRYQEDAAAPAEPEMQQYQDYQSPPATAAPLQPRQQYTYGEAYDNAAAQSDDITNGAYSEQPQQQAVYNLEAYGDYASYSAQNAQQQYGTAPAAPGAGRHHDDDPYGGI